MEIIEKADRIAEEAHRGQVRKTDDSPYINHPRAVAEIVKGYGFSDVTIAAALVHDVLEDTAVSEVELRSELGDEVVDIVTAVSENKDLEWEERKKQYVDAVVAAGESVWAVSVADKIHNAQSVIAYYSEVGDAIWGMFNRGKDKKLWFENLLLSKLKTVWIHPMLAEYEMLVKEMEGLH